MRAPAAVAALALSLATPAARADPAADAAVGLYDAHRRFVEALAAAGWRRDDPRVRAAADEATAVALPALDAGGALADEARALAHDAAGAPLGPWLRRPENARDSLLAAWLRERPDAELEAAAARRPPHERVVLALAAAARRPPFAASLLRGALADGGAQYAAACGVAMALPAALRREFAAGLVAREHRLRDARCLALFASAPAQRAELARDAAAALARGDGDEALWATMASFLALPAAPPPLAPALSAAIDRYAADELSAGYVEAVAQVGPWVARSHPRVAAALARLEARRGAPTAALLPLRVGLDSARLPWLWSLAGDVRHLADERDDTVTRLALALPHRPDVEARALDALARARPRLPAYGGRGAVARLDAWADAVARVRACATDACLRDVVTTGSPEAAARALVVLGAASLGAPETARVVVERMALERAGDRVQGLGGPDDGSVFGVVVFALGAGCPEGLRPIAGMEAAGGPFPHDVASAWRAAFVARCNERAPPGGR